MPHIVHTLCEVVSKALEVKGVGFDVDENGTVTKLDFSYKRMDDAGATELAQVHEQMPM